jgi:FXSXX-COOH protein
MSVAIPVASDAGDLPDLGSVDLGSLLELEAPVLARSVERVLAEADRPGVASAGFSSAL